jgi:hypothetical protein
MSDDVVEWLASVRFKELSSGERFRFNYGFGQLGDEVYARTGGRGYRCELTGHRYETGANVTVVRVLAL